MNQRNKKPLQAAEYMSRSIDATDFIPAVVPDENRYIKSQAKYQKFITETKIFVQGGQTDSNCNALLFINTGIDPVNVDGLVLNQNQSWSIEGNFNEMLIKVYSFSFITQNSPALTIIYKRYVD